SAALSDPATPNAVVQPGGRFYEQREVVYQGLNAIPGISVIKPKAAFYCFPKLDSRFNITDDEKFAMDFLHQEKVLLINGTGFSWDKPDHFRVVYLPEADVLKTAIDKLANFLSGYKQH
ncbi:MAG TPA: aspartate aminotransferase, partial [Clostridiales bacterium]|nr:aspartate aminotransferase [Clostridiales bacterium]